MNIKKSHEIYLYLSDEHYDRIGVYKSVCVCVWKKENKTGGREKGMNLAEGGGRENTQTSKHI